jgi:hypothetical protein
MVWSKVNCKQFVESQQEERIMIVAGVLLKSNLARIVTLSGIRHSHSMIARKFNKLELPKNPTQDDVNVFSQAFKAFCFDNAIDKVVINKRATSGQGAGGAATFRTEGVILAISPVPVTLIHTATVTATHRKQAELKTCRPDTADLGKAYDFAFEALK